MKERIYNGLLVMSLLFTIRNDRLLSAPRIRMPRDKSDIGEMAKWFSNGFREGVRRSDKISRYIRGMSRKSWLQKEIR